MANIPSNAVSASLDAILRPANDSLHARQMQALKNTHHHEDVEELDDSAVDSIRDQAQQHHKQDQEETDEGGGGEEKLDIQSLKNQQQPPKSEPATPSRLDISA
ncbi:MAG: hypothetical protein FWD61_00600 [Phycisphaerales bacterium]|nr:hypothetical protein [Phycisphaerales bacterium]